MMQVSIKLIYYFIQNNYGTVQLKLKTALQKKKLNGNKVKW